MTHLLLVCRTATVVPEAIAGQTGDSHLERLFSPSHGANFPVLDQGRHFLLVYSGS